MKYYAEKFGFEITKDKLPKILCICGHEFIMSREYYIINKQLITCPKCGEYWHVEDDFYKEGTTSLIHPKTNRQIHLEHKKKIRF